MGTIRTALRTTGAAALAAAVMATGLVGLAAEPASAAVGPVPPGGRTSLVSASDPGGYVGDGASGSAVDISDDGNYIVFESKARHLTSEVNDGSMGVYLRDRSSGRTRRIDTYSTEPQISGNGQYVVYTRKRPSDAVKGVYLWTVATGQSQLISRPASGQPNGDSDSPSVSADGQKVAFSSAASNLVPGDLNQGSDVFVREAAQVRKVTTNPPPEHHLVQCNPYTHDEWDTYVSSERSSLSKDGRYLFYVQETRNKMIRNECTGAVGYPTIGSIFTCANPDGSAFSQSSTELYTDPNTSQVAKRQVLATNAVATTALKEALAPDGETVAYGETAFSLTCDHRIYRRSSVSTTGATMIASKLPYHPVVHSFDPTGAFLAFTMGKGAYVLRISDGTYWRVDRRAGGVPSDTGVDDRLRVAGGGGLVVWASTDATLVASDSNGAQDVFVHERDVTAPDTTISTTTVTFTSGKPTFAFTADEPVSQFRCKLTGAVTEDWEKCSSGWGPRTALQARLPDGVYTVQVEATDVVGNVEVQPAAKTFFVDATPPLVNLTGPVPTPSNNRKPVWFFSSPETSTVFLCEVRQGTTVVSSYRSCQSGQAPMTYSSAGLNAGTYTFSVKGRDPAGNESAARTQTFTIDLTGPGAPAILAPTNGLVTRTSPVSLSYLSVLGNTYKCALVKGDGAPPGWQDPCPNPRSYAMSVNGTYTIWLVAKDAAGNESPAAKRTFTFDNAAPNTELTSAPPAALANANVTYTATFRSPDDPTAKFACTSPFGFTSDCTSPRTLTWSQSGTWTIQALDAAGNKDETPVKITVTIDKVAPTVQIRTGPATAGAVRPSDITFTSPDTMASFECLVDQQRDPARCSSPFSTSSLPDGPHTFQVWAVDPAGNRSAPATRTFTLDTTAPVTTMDGPTGAISTTRPSYLLGPAETGMRWVCTVDGTAATCPTTGRTWTPTLTAGTHTLAAYALDSAGNRDTSAEQRTVTVDARAPITTITGGPGNGSVVTTSSVLFTFRADEDGSTFECNVGRGFGPCSGSGQHAMSGLGNGTYTFSVRAKDPAGNTGAAQTRAFTVATTSPVAPETSIQGGPTTWSTTTTPSFTLVSTIPGSTFRCRIVSAGIDSPSCDAAYSVTLGQGTHTLEVWAKSPAGIEDPTAATRTFTVDSIAPPVSVSQPASPTNDTTPTFGLTSPDPTATFLCRLDGATSFTGCPAIHSPQLSGQGAHVLRVKAVDLAGNETAIAVERTVVLDTIAPDTGIVAPGPLATNDNTPTITFTSTEAGATFRCKINAGDPGPCPATQETFREDGSYVIEAWATDPAGNEDPTSAVWILIVDTRAPVVTIAGSEQAAAPTNDTSPTVDFTVDEAPVTVQCAIDVQGDTGFVSCGSGWEAPAQADGSHEITVQATDAAGNTGESTKTVVIDTAPPNTTLNGPGAFTNQKKPTFTFTAEAGSTFSCTLDTTVVPGCTSPFTPTVELGDGPHTLQVLATDAAGNVELDPAVRSFTVDTVAGTSTITGGPSGLTNLKRPMFTFTNSETGTVQCRVVQTGVTPPAGFTACLGPAGSHTPTVDLPADGAYTFQVRVNDQAGNVGVVASRAFTLDATAPDTTLTSGAVDPRIPTPSFTFTSPDTSATFECRLVPAGVADPATVAWAACTSGQSLSPAITVDGEYTFEVRANDPATNVDASPATQTFIYDVTPPDTTITGGPGNGTTTSNRRPSWTFTSTEPDPPFAFDFQCKIDAGDWVPCNSGYTVPEPGLSPGVHTFQVRAVDRVVNIDLTPETRTFTVV